MKNIRNSFILILTLIVSLKSLASEPQKAPQEAIDTLHTYFWASYKELGGKYTDANAWYNKLMESNPPHYANKGYVAFLSTTGQASKILSLLPSLEDLFANDVEMQLSFAQALQKCGKTKESEDRFLRLSSKFKHDQSIAFQAATIYVRRHELDNALATINDLLNNSPKRPNNFIFHFLKAQIYTQANQPEMALACAKECLNLHPRFDKGILLYSLLEEQLGNLTAALAGFNSYVEITASTNQEIQQHILQLTFKQKLAQEHMHKTFMNKSAFEKALYLFENKNYQEALKTIELSLTQKPHEIENKLLKVQILSALKQYGAAAEQLKAWILQEPTNQVLFDTLHLLCRTNSLEYQKAINILEQILHQHPDNVLATLHLADLNTRAHTYDRALHYHTKALKLTPDKQIQTKILFTMGLIYHEQGDVDAMEKVLEQGLKLNTNFPPLLNLLAYHYATENKKLPEAQALITLALQKNENNPHFLDTQALIFYAQKEYKKALALLTSIEPKATQDFSVLRNLSRTQYMIGNTQEAITTMKRASLVAHHDQEKKACTSLLCQWGVQQ